MAVTDDLNAAIAAITFQDLNNAPIASVNIAALQAIVPQLTPSPVVDELNDAINQMAWKAQTNAPVGQPLINQLNDVTSQLLYGTSTTNPPDVAAIQQLTSAILIYEPEWAPLLWINFLGTTLTVQVTGVYTPLTMTINAVPWWTNWLTFDDAANNLIATIYLLGSVSASSTTTMSEQSGICALPVREQVAAPAVHAGDWRHWSFAEGQEKATYIVPEGCGVAVNGDEIMLQELATQRIFNPPPRSPDAQAWWDANHDDMRGGKNWKRRQDDVAAPRASPWSWSGGLYSWQLSLSLPQRFTYMASFLGVSQFSTNNCPTSIWPGLQPSSNYLVMQPILQHSQGNDAQNWQVWNNIYANTNQTQFGTTPVPFHIPQGAWGVIREYGGQGMYMIGWFRGNRGNTGPAFGQPVKGTNGATCAPLWITINNPPQGVSVSSSKDWIMEEAILELEIAGGGAPTQYPYTCADLAITAVFGGITVSGSPNPMPVSWTHGFNAAIGPGGISCIVTEPPILNATTNGRTQLSATYTGS
jgi:hypothetical protein